MKDRAISLYLAAFLIAPLLAYGQAEVSYAGGLLSVRCNELPLVQVFEQIKTNTGIELILEDSIKTIRLTANIDAKPVHMALERLLEGSGVNYAMSFDPQDWTRVTAIFVGSGGEGPSSPAPQASTSSRPVRRGAARRAEPVDDDFNEPDPDEIMDDEDFGVEEYEDDGGPDAGFESPDNFDAPPESGLSPPPPSYPRSPFTPGLESNPFGSSNQQQAQPESEPQQEDDPDVPPPAYYPFLDRDGKPIPVPPGTVPRRPTKKKNP